MNAIKKYLLPVVPKSIHIPDSFVVRKNGMKDFQGYAFVVFQGTSDLASVLAKYPNIPINSEHIETVLGLPLPYYRCISMYMISSILYV